MNISDKPLREKLHLFSGDGNSLIKILKAATMIGYASKPFQAGKIAKYNYPGLQFADGPRGIVLGNSTCYPVTMARAATWNTELEHEVGKAIGLELRAQGGNAFGGVCINLVRHPAWGRAQESYGEDPIMLGKMGVAVSQGVQENAMAVIKHFAVNSIEVARFKVDVKIDDRALHEVYLPHFKMCIDGGAAVVMSAYNLMNGHYCGENKHLLTDILRKQWGFKGFVIADWVLGVRNGIKGFNAGLDIEMPAKLRFFALRYGIRKKLISRERIDEAAHAVFDTIVEFEKKKKSSYHSMDELRKKHAKLALQAAHESMVLLRNEKVGEFPLLPLSVDKSKKYALIGALAKVVNIGDHGSSRVRPTKAITIYEGVEKGLGGADLLYDDGKNIQSAASVSKTAETAIVIVGYKYNDEGEYIPPQGGDRKSLHLSSHDENLIKEVVKANPKTIVVMIGGSAIVTPWSNNVPALLMAWYPGQEGGTALWNIITGKENPSGKLPMAFPKNEKDTPFFDRNAKKITYDHYHGYRYLDKHNLQPRFAFGFGLSYTNFELAEPTFKWDDTSSTGIIGTSISNSGGTDGATVIQVYAGYPEGGIDRPLFELKDFKRMNIIAGASEDITFDISARMFAYYRPVTKDWFSPEGTYTFYIGTSGDLKDLKSVSCQLKSDKVYPE